MILLQRHFEGENGTMIKLPAKYDVIVLLIVLTLTCFGLVMVYSSSAVMAERVYHDGFYFLKRQGAFAAIGLLIMYGTMQVDYNLWKKLAVWVLIASLVLLCLVLIPGIGGSAGGSSRWIKLVFGFRFQPSELAKIAFIMYMAYSLDRKMEKVKSLIAGFVPYMIVLVLLLVLLLKQPDLGSAIILAAVAFAMLFAAGTRLSHIFSVILLSLPIVHHLFMGVGYRKRRMMAFWDPWQDPQNTGFQIIQSWLALGRGGIWGQGLGESSQKLFFLPEAHTDFILAVVGEELGLIGLIAIIGMFFLLVQRGLMIALATPDNFGRFLALGISVLFGLEAVINMGVVTGLLPTKGLALPFISYGGSSLVVSLFAVGILLSISARLPKSGS